MSLFHTPHLFSPRICLGIFKNPQSLLAVAFGGQKAKTYANILHQVLVLRRWQNARVSSTCLQKPLNTHTIDTRSLNRVSVGLNLEQLKFICKIESLFRIILLPGGNSETRNK